MYNTAEALRLAVGLAVEYATTDVKVSLDDLGENHFGGVNTGLSSIDKTRGSRMYMVLLHLKL